MNYLRLFGYKNLLLIAATQLLIHYSFFIPFQVDISFNNLGIGLFVFSTLCLAAAGSCIIAVYNREADQVNHPQKIVVGKSISEQTAVNLFILLNVIAVGIGFYLSNGLGYPQFSALYIIVSGLLYLYATFLRKQLLIGNLILAALAALVPIGMGLFELMPMITPQNQATQNTIFSILLDYSVFAFLMIWLREMLSGQITIDGDHKAQNETLSLKIGIGRTNTILFVLALSILLSVFFYMYKFLFQKEIVILYCLVLVMAPLILFLIKAISAKGKKDFFELKGILEIALWAGAFSIGLYRFVLLG